MTPRKLLINHLNPSSLLQRGWILILLVVGSFAFSPQTRAACDSPDPGCSGGNLAEGFLSLGSLTTGLYNTGIGAFSLLSNTEGSLNTGVGAGTLLSSGAANGNTAVGAGALLSTTAGGNTAVGRFAMSGNTIGTNNTAVGSSAMSGNTEGSFNVAIGEGAGFGLTTGSNNTIIGEIAGGLITDASGTICIGSGGGNVSNACFIGHIRDVTTVNNNAIPVLVDSAGQLGTMSSSARFKKEIKPMDKASEAILALKPVTFHYKSDKTNRPEFGLIAEEVAKVDPNLVVRDSQGEIYTVRYEAVNAMLLNEFLKEHQSVQDLKTMVAQQKKQIEALTAGLQKVTAQLEVNKPAPQTVANE
jgi:hypothetical protein